MHQGAPTFYTRWGKPARNWGVGVTEACVQMSARSNMRVLALVLIWRNNLTKWSHVM
jgi:hypothetical protein